MAASRLAEIRQARLEKLAKLRELGINPYPAKFSRPHIPVSQALKESGHEVSVVGRIWRLREHGSVVFADLRDSSGQIQLLFQEKVLAEKFALLKLVDIGDFLGAAGQVITTQAGQITVDVSHFELLTKSLRPLPDDWHGLKDIEERYRQRYVDLLLSDQVRQVFATRTQIVKFLRQYLDSHGFTEVETPVLQSVYGGTVAKPFMTHHNALDTDFYLRISDELYLKRLVVGGIDKVYEISKDFRNEGFDRAHNPEFTMLEFYWAYSDYEELMTFTEQMLSELVASIHSGYKFTYQDQELDFTPPWPRISYRDVILQYSGIDIDVADTAAKLLAEITSRRIDLNLKGVAGFGNIMDTLYKHTARPHLVGPLFLTDRPTEFVTLAKRRPDDPRRTASFQLLAAGEELLTAYNELNDPQDQAERWRESENQAAAGAEEHENLDTDYLRALEYGMPPTAGWGMGIDRLTAVLTNQPTLKDTILFPTLRPEQDEVVPKRQDFAKKLVIVINPDLPSWQIMNTSAHAAAFLGNKMAVPFDTGKSFLTKDGTPLPRNSQYAIVTLSASPEELKALSDEVRKSGLLYIGYVPEMMETTNDKKLADMLLTKTDEEINYAGIGIFGPKDQVDKLTKKFPLWDEKK